MPVRHVVVSAHNGVHARPVAAVDLRSVLAVMDLALAPGDAVTLETPAGPASESVLDQLTRVLAPDA